MTHTVIQTDSDRHTVHHRLTVTLYLWPIILKTDRAIKYKAVSLVHRYKNYITKAYLYRCLGCSLYNIKVF
jgi:hypothetical protein